MRIALVLLSLPLLGACLSACGGAGKTVTGPSSTDPARKFAGADTRTVPPGGYLKSDSDKDADEHQKGPSNEDMGEMVTASHGARPADKRAIAAVVKRYYAAAVAGDGATGCSLLDPALAEATAHEQTPIAAGTGKSCAASLSRLFAQQHKRLAAEEPATMVVTGVHVDGDAGLVTLGFRAAPEGELVLQRDSGVWKVDALFESGLP